MIPKIQDEYEERTPTQWGNRYIGQLLSRLEELEVTREVTCPHCGEAVSLESVAVILPEIAKKDIRSTLHACAQSVANSEAIRRKKQEEIDDERAEE